MAQSPQSSSSSRLNGKKWFIVALLCLLAALVAFFAPSFNPDKVLFANDGPLGAAMAKAIQPPDSMFGVWMDLNWIGNAGGTYVPSATFFLFWILRPLLFMKFYAPISLLFLGVSAWIFFRQLRLHPFVCVIGALAAMLNTNSFSNVCWGLGTRALSMGAIFLALAAFEASKRHRFPWIYLVLGGIAVGIGVCEGADNGAIYSLFVAAYVAYSTWQERGRSAAGAGLGIARVAVIAIFAGIMAAQAIGYLVPTAVKTVMHTKVTEETKQADWDFATQWSLPKAEVVRLLIPGIYGYRMDTPDGGQYWGRVGRSPGYQSGPQGARHSGSGEYPGLVVVLIAAWAIGQAFRKDGSMLSDYEKRMVKFCAIAAFICLLFAFGRHAPFYRIMYSLPYFSSIRNPIKFMHPFHLALLILFGYGLQELFRRLTTTQPVRPSMIDQVKAWWVKAAVFEKRWIYGLLALFGSSVLGFLIFSSSSRELVGYLTNNGFDDASGREIVSFSRGEFGYYLLFLMGSIAIFILLVSGALSGRKLKWAGIVVGLLLLVDMLRANAPWVQYQDYKQKYASNPIIDILANKPYEHRVATKLFPFGQSYLANNPQVMGLMDEWMQHLFQYYNIHSLDVIQMPRPSEFEKAFMEKLRPTSDTNLTPASRMWHVTNTRFILGMRGYLQLLNEQVDPINKPFRVHTAFNMAAKPGVTQPKTFADVTVTPNPDGQLALIENTKALPRSALFTKWQIVTNDDAVLNQLAAPDFDPTAQVLLSDTPVAIQSGTANQLGAAEYLSYATKEIKLHAKVDAPSILLLNDKYDPEWRVYVDGKTEKLLRCNYIMRGVALPPGDHQITFRYEPALHGLYTTLGGLALGLLLCCVVPFIPEREEKAAASNPRPA